MSNAVKLQQQAALFQSLMGQLSTIIDDAADEDHAGTWGLDGWIRTIHNLIDLQIRACAAGVQLGLSGPGNSPTASSGTAQEACEYFDVATADYPRRYIIVEPFTRVGKSDSVIPNDKLTFSPAVLPAGQGRFALTVADDTYIGSNFTGCVGFCAVTAPTNSPPEGQSVSITVGL